MIGAIALLVFAPSQQTASYPARRRYSSAQLGYLTGDILENK